jgi:hypothetical protein
MENKEIDIMRSGILIEPLMENRYIIELIGSDIPSYSFKEYSLHNEGTDFIFMTRFYETCNYTFNPKSIFDITDVVIKYLDPVGDAISGLRFKIKGINFSRKQSYANSELQMNDIKIIVDAESMTLYSEIKKEVEKTIKK